MEKTGEFDVVIVGGGPAGMAALRWCSDLGMPAVLLERNSTFGGQLLQTYAPITNYLGAEAANGRELRDTFLRQGSNGGVERFRGAEVVEADLIEKTITTADEMRYSGRAIVVATGVRRRELGIPGEREFRGRGILESGAKERNDIRDKLVVIAGGGDAALENALILADTAEKVFVVHRRQAFRARKEFLEAASKNERIEFVTGARCSAITGDDAVNGVELEDLESGTVRTIPTDAILIRIGVVPNTELFHGQIQLDDAGFIKIDSNCKTSLDDVYAIGDAANPSAPTIAAAVGQASIAVKTIRAGI